MQWQVALNNDSFDRAGITKDCKDAVCEYIWNSFEAGASKVSVSMTGNSTDELSELQRHEILKRVLENKLYSKIALMSFLDWLIARSEKVTKKNMTASIQKWRSDRAYVASYELSNSRSVKVGKIRYNQ